MTSLRHESNEGVEWQFVTREVIEAEFDGERIDGDGKVRTCEWAPIWCLLWFIFALGQEIVGGFDVYEFDR